MKCFYLRAAAAVFLMASLSSCSLIAAPFKLIGNAAGSIIRSFGGLGGAARLAPLLLDAKENQKTPVRGAKIKLLDKAPSERRVDQQELVKKDGPKSTAAEG